MASAQTLSKIPAGTAPYVSVEELIISKIVSSSGLTQLSRSPLKIGKDAGDARQLLRTYPETIPTIQAQLDSYPITTENQHRQILDKFLSENKLLHLQKVQNPPPIGTGKTPPLPAIESPPQAPDIEDPGNSGKGPKESNEVCVISKRDGLGCRTRARASAARRYEQYARKHKLTHLTTRQNKPLSFDRLTDFISAKFDGKVGYRAKLAAAKSLGGVGTAFSIGVWAKSIATVFTDESSALDRLSITTSLIPAVGCVTQGAQDNENERNQVVNGIDISLCVVADILAFIPGAGVVSTAIHLARSLFRHLESLIFPKESPPIEKTHFQYKWGWQQYLFQLEKIINSQEFKGNLTSELLAAKADILVMAAEAAGTIDATLSLGGANETDKETDSQDAISKTNATTGLQAPSVTTTDSLGKRDDDDASKPKDGQGEPGSAQPSEPVNVPDFEPLICPAYLAKKKQIYDQTAEKLEKHLEEAYAKYDLEFFNDFFWFLRKLLRKNQPWASTDKLDEERDKHIQDVKESFARRDHKPGLEPGPKMNRMREILDIIFDEATRGDTCKEPRKPLMINGVEVLPTPEVGGDLPNDESLKRKQEDGWAEDLKLKSLQDQENELKDMLWAQVRQKVMQLRVQSDAWPPQPDSDSPDPARDFDQWGYFNGLMEKHDQGLSGPQSDKEGPGTPGDTNQGNDRQGNSDDQTGNGQSTSRTSPPSPLEGTVVRLWGSSGFQGGPLDLQAPSNKCGMCLPGGIALLSSTLY